MRKQKKFNKQEQKLLAFWAADCAEHVLLYFEKEYPKDNRPRKAIKAAKDWACDRITVGQARMAAIAAHAAARSVDSDAACSAARAAGHAAATAHVARHAFPATNYAVQAAEAANVINEREWQHKHFPKNLSIDRV